MQPNLGKLSECYLSFTLASIFFPWTSHAFFFHYVHNELFYTDSLCDAIQLKIIQVRKNEYSDVRDESFPVS